MTFVRSLAGGVAGSLQGGRQALTLDVVGGGGKQRADDGGQTAG